MQMVIVLVRISRFEKLIISFFSSFGIRDGWDLVSNPLNTSPHKLSKRSLFSIGAGAGLGPRNIRPEAGLGAERLKVGFLQWTEDIIERSGDKVENKDKARVTFLPYKRAS